MEVIYMPLGDITPYENNAKLHPDEQIEQIKESISEFGFNDPIAIWGDNNTVVEGHGRLIAAQELGYTEVPVIRLDNLTDEQRKAYALVHNKLTMNSGFDFDALQQELIRLENSEINMLDFGFSDDEDFNIDEMFENAPEQEPEHEKQKNEPHFIICPHCGERIEMSEKTMA